MHHLSLQACGATEGLMAPWLVDTNIATSYIWRLMEPSMVWWDHGMRIPKWHHLCLGETQEAG